MLLATEVPLHRATFSVAVSECDSNECVDSAADAARVRLDAQKRRVPEARAADPARWRTLVEGPYATSALVSDRVDKVVPINRAYHKLREIMLSCAIPGPVCSVHLCEAPGGFVQATARCAHSDWRWAATSLPTAPYPRVDHLTLAGQGRFLFGDVLDVEASVAQLSEFVTHADVVTADGAVAMDHDQVESEHLPLLRAQLQVAAHLLRPGGTLVVKCFEVLRLATWVEVARLTHLFESVSLMKPTSSRPTNSERYVVARGFAGNAQRLHDSEPIELSVAWRAHVGSIAARMADTQTAHLASVLDRM